MNNPTMTFQQRLQQNQVVLAPGIYDALSALIAEQVHHVPSVVVRADFSDPAAAQNGNVRRLLLKPLPPTAVASQLGQAGSLLVLLPFGGEMEAATLLRQDGESRLLVRLAQAAPSPLGTPDDLAHTLRRAPDAVDSPAAAAGASLRPRVRDPPGAG